MTPENRQHIDLRIRAAGATTEGEVYRYLIFNQKWNRSQGKAMLAQAAQDYWLADARRYVDPELAKTTALACIERMEYRIAKLRQDFGLEPPDRARLEQSELVKLLIQLTAEVQRIPQSLAAISTAIASGGVVQPPLAPPIAAVNEPTEPAKEDIYSAENVMAVFDMIGSPAEDLNTDLND